MLPLDSIPYKEGVGHMEEGKYYRANINRSHDLVKSKVLILLRFMGTWHTTTELADLCKFKSNGTMRSHCGLWAKKHVDKHNHVHDGILLRRARGLVGVQRPVWEYSISERGKRWAHWNIDEAGLLTTIMEELGLAPKSDIITPTTNGDNKTIDDRMIQEVVNSVLTSLKPSPLSNSIIEKPSVPIPDEASTTASGEPAVEQPEFTNDETVPEAVVQEVTSAWWNQDECALSGVKWDELYLCYDDRLYPSDRAGVHQKKLLHLAQGAWEIKKKRESENDINKSSM
jgi:hypothetical protein